MPERLAGAWYRYGYVAVYNTYLYHVRLGLIYKAGLGLPVCVPHTAWSAVIGLCLVVGTEATYLGYAVGRACAAPPILITGFPYQWICRGHPISTPLVGAAVSSLVEQEEQLRVEQEEHLCPAGRR